MVLTNHNENRHTYVWIAVLAVIFTVIGKPANADYSWKNVTFGCGGFVSGIIPSTNQSNLIYARTDVGGAYKWNSTTDTWTPITDWLSNFNQNGVESIALDPNNANKLYIGVGNYGYNSAILISSDQGNTFTTIDVSSKFIIYGNSDGRGNGERLQVDPNLGSVLFYGTRQNGLWKSTDSGSTWSQLTSFPVTTTSNGNGICFLQFVKSSGTSGSATPKIFAGVSQSGTSLYMSSNRGSSWSAVSGQPSSTSGLVPQHCALDASNNALYVTFANGPGPSVGNGRALCKYNISTSTWTDVTPPIISSESSSNIGGLSGLTVDPQKPGTVMVCTISHYWPNHEEVYRSTNGGSTWNDIFENTGATWDAKGTWAQTPVHNWTCDIEIDPFNSNHVMITSGYGIFECNNITSADSGGSTSWVFNDGGCEETVVNEIITPATGAPLMCAIWDYAGFRSTDSDLPATQFANPNSYNGSIDYAETNPNYVVRTHSGAAGGAYSTDNGVTWTDFPAHPSTVSNGSNMISISANGSYLVWIPSNSAPYYSTNSGTSWTQSTGGPTGTYQPVSDRSNSSYFYIYVPSTGAFYRSSNNGASFSQTTTLATWGSAPVTVRGRSGDVWMPLGSGLWHSTNYGTSFTQVSGVTCAKYVAFGKAASGQTYPAIYLYGSVNNVWGFFRSDNGGSSWTQLNDSKHNFATTQCLAADWNVYGRFYIGTNGRGIIQGDIQAVANGATYGFINGSSGYAMDVNGASLASGASVIQWTYGAANNQRYTITYLGGNNIKLKNVNSGLLVEVLNSSLANGGTIDQKADSGGSNQIWHIDVVNDNSSPKAYKLTNLYSLLVLEDPGWSTTLGTTLGQWSWAGGYNYNQQWSLK